MREIQDQDWERERGNQKERGLGWGERGNERGGEGMKKKERGGENGGKINENI